MSAKLIGRDAEESQLDSLLDDLEQGLSSALVLAGGPGVGKSALLAYVSDSAVNCQVARLSGIESEAHLSFSGLHRLLIPYGEQIDELPTHLRESLMAAIGFSAQPAPTTPLLGLAVLGALAHVADRQPLVCIFDDVHWLDYDTLEVLGFVARRLYAERLCLLFGLRIGGEVGGVEGLPVLSVTDLNHHEATSLIRSFAPDRIDPQVAERLAIQAGGNPLILSEVGKQVAAGKRPSQLLMGDPLPVGERLETYYHGLAAELPADTQQLLLLYAANVIGDAAKPSVVAAQLGVSSEAAIPAFEASLITLDPEIEFRHPLIRSAVYRGASVEDRRRAHKVLAQFLDPESERDIRAWHLACAAFGVDETVASELESCAQDAHDRGGYLVQSAYLSRAASLSPDHAERARRLLAAAEAAQFGGAPRRAADLLDEASPFIDDPKLQAYANRIGAYGVPYALGLPGGHFPSVLVRSAQVLAEYDPDLGSEVMLDALTDTILRGGAVTEMTLSEIGQAALDLPHSDTFITSTPGLTLRACATFFSQGYEEAAPLVQTARMALNDWISTEHREVPRWNVVATHLFHTYWDDEGMDAFLRCCETSGRQEGSPQRLLEVLPALALIESARGDTREIERIVSDIETVIQSAGADPTVTAFVGSCSLYAWRGDGQRLEEAAAAMDLVATFLEADTFHFIAVWARLVFHMSGGNYREAFDIASEAVARDKLQRQNEILYVLVEAGVKIRERDQAEIALERLRTRAKASGTPWALGVLARAEAFFGPVDQCNEHYLQSIELLKKTGVTAELAKTYLAHGEWLRREGHPIRARIRLRDALELFDALGATLYSARCESELAAAGETVRTRPQVPETHLTSQELRVAELASQGATNQEIADGLFISRHTVDFHLRKIFRKLGITSRRELRGALAR